MDPVFGQEYCVILVRTHREFVQIAKKETGFDVEPGERIAGELHGLHSDKNPDLALIWSSDKDTNLVHELLHATAWILRNRCIYLNEESEETYAYYLTYLLRNIKKLVKYDK